MHRLVEADPLVRPHRGVPLGDDAACTFDLRLARAGGAHPAHHVPLGLAHRADQRGGAGDDEGRVRPAARRQWTDPAALAVAVEPHARDRGLRAQPGSGGDCIGGQVVERGGARRTRGFANAALVEDQRCDATLSQCTRVETTRIAGLRAGAMQEDDTGKWTRPLGQQQRGTQLPRRAGDQDALFP